MNSKLINIPNQTVAEDNNLPFPSRHLEISGEDYLLKIIPLETVDGWRWQLKTLTPDELIPGGFKLRLLKETTESILSYEAISRSPVKYLYIDLKVEPNSKIIVEIEPIPENYYRDTWIFGTFEY